MSNAKVVSSLVERASENHGGPAWLAEATALLSKGGEKVFLVNSMVTAPEDEDEETMDAYALFTCTSHVLFSGKSVVTTTDNSSMLVAFLKKHRLDAEFGIHKGKLAIMLTTDCEVYTVESQS